MNQKSIPTWPDIVSTAEFRKLNPETQEQYRNQYFDNYIVPQLPQKTPEFLAYAREKYDYQTKDTIDKPDIERTWGEAAKDTGAAIMGGFAGLGSGLAQLTDTFTPLPDSMTKPAREATESAQDYWNSLKSPSMQQSQQKLQRSEGISESLGTAVKNPEIIGDMIAQSAPSMLVPMGAGRMAFQAGVAGKEAATAAMKAAAAKRATAAVAITGGIQEGAMVGADAYNEVLKKTPEELLTRSAYYKQLRQTLSHEEAIIKVAEKAGLTTQALVTPISILASKLTGAAGVEAKFFTGEGFKNFLGSLRKEATEEIIQEGGGQFSQNAAIRAFADDERDISQDVGKNAAMGALVAGAQTSGMKGLGVLANPTGAFEFKPSADNSGPSADNSGPSADNSGPSAGNSIAVQENADNFDNELDAISGELDDIDAAEQQKEIVSEIKALTYEADELAQELSSRRVERATLQMQGKEKTDADRWAKINAEIAKLGEELRAKSQALFEKEKLLKANPMLDKLPPDTRPVNPHLEKMPTPPPAPEQRPFNTDNSAPPFSRKTALQQQVERNALPQQEPEIETAEENAKPLDNSLVNDSHEHTDQFNHYRAYLENNELTAGLREQIWIDERLDDGEAQLIFDKYERSRQKPRIETATHIEPDSGLIEAADPEVIENSIEDATKNNAGRTVATHKEVQDWLKGEIADAIAKAPAKPSYTYNEKGKANGHTDYVTFDVPHDGKFKVANNKASLEDFAKKVKTLNNPPHPDIDKEIDKSIEKGKGATAEAAIVDMLRDGEESNAINLAESAGLKTIFTPNEKYKKQNIYVGSEITPEELALFPAEIRGVFKPSFVGFSVFNGKKEFHIIDTQTGKAATPPFAGAKIHGSREAIIEALADYLHQKAKAGELALIASRIANNITSFIEKSADQLPDAQKKAFADKHGLHDLLGFNQEAPTAKNPQDVISKAPEMEITSPEPKSLTQELSAITDADLEAMFDEMADSKKVADTAKPVTKRTRKTQKGELKPEQSKAEAATTAPTRRARSQKRERSIGEIGKSLGVNLSSAGVEGSKALYELFGGKNNLNSGLAFDEQTYAKAKPHFIAMLKDFSAAGKDLRAFVQALLENFGSGIKPYVLRFAQDFRAGRIDLDENSAASNTKTETTPTEDTPNEPSDDVDGLHEKRDGGLSGQHRGDDGPNAGGLVRRQGVSRDDRSEALGEQHEDTPRSREGDSDAGGVLPAEQGRNNASDLAGEADSAVTPAPKRGRPPKAKTEPNDAPEANSSPAQTAPAQQDQDADNYSIGETQLAEGGAVTRYNNNVAAIQLLKTLQAEKRRPSNDEKAVLAKYIGWGGIPQAFKNRMTGEVSKGWEAREQALRELLTSKEYDAARASTLNAHYTSKPVVDFMYRALDKLGFKGGNILEPSVGVGNFIGWQPTSLKLKNRFLGVELDSITAGIASYLYGREKIINSGFEKVPLPSDTFDVVIGNPPFGSEKLFFKFAPEVNPYSIHNQFILASGDAVKPNGFLAVVVSRYFMDSSDSKARQQLAQQFDLVAAYRLPDTAFLDNANTEVVTDILVFKKHPEPDYRITDDGKSEPIPWSGNGAQWQDLSAIPDPLGGGEMKINQWFKANPKAVFGRHERSGKMQGSKDGDKPITVKLDASQDLEALLNTQLAAMPAPLNHRPLAESKIDFDALLDSIVAQMEGKVHGSIEFDTDGSLNLYFDQDAGNGFQLKKIKVDANTPWHGEYQLDEKGQWYTLETVLDDKGKPKKDPIKKNLNLKEKVVHSANNIEHKLGNDGLKQLKDIVKMRDGLIQLINDERDDSVDTKTLEKSRAALRQQVEQYHKTYGFLNGAANTKGGKHVKLLADGPLIEALEFGYTPAISPAQSAKTGEPVAPANAELAGILKQRINYPYKSPERAESVNDAIQITMHEKGRLDNQRLMGLLGVDNKADLDAAMREHNQKAGEKTAFIDPANDNEWVTSGEYLSGNVADKIKLANAAGLADNVTALESVRPTPLEPHQIHVGMGANWIDVADYTLFARDITGDPSARVTVSKNGDYAVMAKSDSHVARVINGTNKISAGAIMERLLNNSPIKIMVTIDDKLVFDPVETEKANEKAEKITDAFKAWLWRDEDRRQRSKERFNDMHNSTVNRKQQGNENLVLEGKVPDSMIKFRRHQNRAVQRGVSMNAVLYDHVVGAGKTFVSVARAMERKRLGLSKKPAIVVPNHMVAQFAKEARELYPAINLITATSKDLEAKNRRRYLAKIAANDWDLVILPHSQFTLIGMHPDTVDAFLQQELETATEALQEAEEVAKDEGGGGFRKPFTVKQAERRVKAIEKMVSENNSGRKDRTVRFEQLGIDDITLDEAHEYKNLAYSSNLTGVKGMGNKGGVKKTLDLKMKLDYLRRIGGGMAFMTGTPVSNSLVELYNLMQYLIPDQLKARGIQSFDSWMNLYAEAEETIRPNDAGILEPQTRLEKFKNLPSLMQLYYSFADVVTLDDIRQSFTEDNDGAIFPVPRVKGGQRKAFAIKPTPAQQEILEEVVSRFERLSHIKNPTQRAAERFKLINIARNNAYDARFARDSALDTENRGGKLDVATDEIARIYKQWTPDKGTQLVFADRGIPKTKEGSKRLAEYQALIKARDEAIAKGDEKALDKIQDKLDDTDSEGQKKFDPDEMASLEKAESGGFTVYGEIKRLLIAKGVKEEEIAFMTDANTAIQKSELFSRVKTGKVRVLVGSTQRMGAGTNVQDLLVGLHHIDVDWKPSSIEQREGRIIRQGNKLYQKYGHDKFEVEINAYVTERTFDQKMWSLNESKMRGINQLRKYNGEFELEFDDSESESLAEVAALASGDPRMLELVQLDSDVKKLKRQSESHQSEQIYVSSQLDAARRIVEQQDDNEAALKAIENDIKAFNSRIAEAAKAVTATIEGTTVNNAKAALEAIAASVAKQQNGNERARYSVDFNGKELTSKDAISQAINEHFPTPDFGIEIDGELIIKADIAGRILKNKIVSFHKENKGKFDQTDFVLGKMAGKPLQISIEPSRLTDGRHEIIFEIRGPQGVRQDAEEYQRELTNELSEKSLARKIKSLMGALSLDVVEDERSNNALSLKKAQKAIETLEAEVGKPWQKEAEYKKKQARYRELLGEVGSKGLGKALLQDGGQSNSDAPVNYDTQWAEPHAEQLNGVIIPVGENIVLIRGQGSLSGSAIYAGAKKNVGLTQVDIVDFTGTAFTMMELELLKLAREKAIKDDDESFANNPDGPFADAKNSVVASDSAPKELVGYLQGFMDQLGIKTRVLLIYGNSAKGIKGLHGPYYSAHSSGMNAREDGAIRMFGPNNRDAYIYLKEGIAGERAIEVLAHEAGHLIQRVEFDNASEEVKREVKKAYDRWLNKAKTLDPTEFIHSLRNRATAEDTKINTNDIKDFSSYWFSFNEWFADNVSRWATTDEKPLTFVDRFFSDIAKKLRQLAQIVTGRQYLPEQSVSDWLNKLAARVMPSDIAPLGDTKPSNFTMEATKNTKTKEPIWVVKIKRELPYSTYSEKVKPAISKHDGYWSNFVKGIIFKSENAANAFMADVDAVLNQSGGKLNTRLDSYTDESGQIVFAKFAELGRGVGDVKTSVADAEAVLGFSSPFDVHVISDMPSGVPMRFNTEQRIIEVSEYWNGKLSRPVMAQMMTEEILHGVDVINPNRTLSAGSKLFAENGAILNEATEHWLNNGELVKFLDYPLNSVAHSDLSPTVVAAELFARLGVLYLGQPQLMKETLPNAYQTYQSLFGGQTESPIAGSGELRPRLRSNTKGNREISVLARTARAVGRDAAKTLGQRRASEGLGYFRERIHKAIGTNAFGGVVDFNGNRLNYLETRPTGGFSTSGGRKKPPSPPPAEEFIGVDEETDIKLGLTKKTKSPVKNVMNAVIHWGETGYRKAAMRSWLRFYEGVADGAHPILRKEREHGVGLGAGGHGKSAYVAYRLGTGVADFMHHVLHFGALRWNDGTLDYKEGTRGLMPLLQEELGKDLNDWLVWMAANRALELKRQGRERNLDKHNIIEGIARARGKKERFERVRKEYIAMNNAMLDVAEKAGLIDPAKRADWQSDYYVPFYRRDDLDGEHEQLLAPYSKRGLSHQSAGIRQLLGSELETNDLLENILMNWAKLVDASVKNDAMKKAVDEFAGTGEFTKVGYDFERVLITNKQIEEILRKDDQRLAQAKAMLGIDPYTSLDETLRHLLRPENEGFTQLWAMKVPQEPDVIRVQRNGKNEYYRVTDDAMLRALLFTGYSAPRGPVRDFVRATKRLLTKGVTLTPDFIVRNYIRDSVHNFAIQKEFKKGIEALDGLKKAFEEDGDYRSLMAGGAAFQGAFATATDPEAVAENIRRGYRKYGMNDMSALKESMLKVWEGYREAADKFENANRLAKYKAAMASGKSRAEALYEAKDLMDFNLRGSHSTMLFFIDAIPFLNAKIQGASRTIRAIKRDPKEWKPLLTKLSMIAMASAALALANLDNDDYRGRPDWEKDMYWFIYSGKDDTTPVRIPKAFEVGFVAGTLPERFVHTLGGEQTAGDIARSLGHNAYATFLFNPIDVQLVKPAVEAAFNYNLLTGAPIDSQAEMSREGQTRHNVYTSTAGYGLGQMTGVSPKRIDHMIKGYLGTMGAYSLLVADMALRPLTDRPEKPSGSYKDLPIASTFTGGTGVKPNKFVGDFYDLAEKTNEVYNTYKRYADEGQEQDAEQVLVKYENYIHSRKEIFKHRQKLLAFTKARRDIENSKTLDREQKRIELDDLQRDVNAYADQLMQSMRAMGLDKN